MMTDLHGNILYYFLECERINSQYALVYNPTNDRCCKPNCQDWRPLSRKRSDRGKADGKYVLLMASFLSIAAQGQLFDEEFEKSFSLYCTRRGQADSEFLDAAYLCCDNLYRRMLERKSPVVRKFKTMEKSGAFGGGSGIVSSQRDNLRSIPDF